MDGKPGAPGDGQARVVRAALRWPEVTIIGGVALLAVLAWSLATYQPWLRFMNSEVHDPAPRGEVFATGGIRPSSSAGAGRIFFVEMADGSRWVRIEDLAIDNGPGRRVVLSGAAGSGTILIGFDEAERFDLGALRGNVGDMTFEVPHFVDLARFHSVVLVSRGGDALAFAPIGY